MQISTSSLDWRCVNCSTYNDVAKTHCHKCATADKSDDASVRFFSSSLTGVTMIKTKDDAQLFLRGVVAHSSPIEMLRALCASTSTICCLQEALSLDASPAFFNRFFVPLLEHLGQDFFSVRLQHLR
jgi:hypothetical protein